MYDAFISHASEDKDSFVRPLAEYLGRNGISVWYDEFSLTPGDSIRRSIDKGIKTSRYAIVVLSESFLNKAWTEWELDGIVQLQLSRNISGLIPIWLNLDLEKVREYSPSISDIVAIIATTPEDVGEKLCTLISTDPNAKYWPDIVQFRKLYSNHSLISIYRKVSSHTLTPAQAHKALADKTGSAFLSSVSDASIKGRYTIIFINPVKSIQGDHNKSEVICLKTKKTKKYDRNVIDILDSILDSFNTPVNALPRINGGAVGYIGFDYASRAIANVHELPCVSFMIYRTAIIFDNVLDYFYVIEHVERDNNDADKVYNLGKQSIDSILDLLNKKARFKPIEAWNYRNKTIEQRKEGIKDNVLQQCNDFISNGDLYKIVISKEEKAASKRGGFDSFLRLLSHNPRPYNFYLNMSGVEILGGSSEMSLRIENRHISLRPVFEYIPEYLDGEQSSVDAERVLLNNDVVLENCTFLIDSAKGDLGKVCESGSIKVTEKFVAERDFISVKVTSRVEGILKKSILLSKVVDACFPSANSIGDPREHALTLSRKIGNDSKFPFGGWVFTISFDRNIDSASMTNAMMIKNNMAVKQTAILLDGKERNIDFVGGLGEYDIFRYL